MKNFIVIGFNAHGVWVQITIKTIAECIALRASEKGITEITEIKEI